MRAPMLLAILTILTAFWLAPAESLASAPAASWKGLDYRGHFATPVEGTREECGGVGRQFVLLTPSVPAGAPVYFRLLVDKATDRANAEFVAKLSYGTDVRFLVHPPNGPPYEYLGGRTGDTVPAAVLQMDEAPHYRIDFRLVMDLETVTGAAFDMPGEYSIRVIHNCNAANTPPSPLEMGTFRLTVTNPDGDDLRAINIARQDHTIFPFFHTRSVTSAREEGSVLSEKHRAMLQRIASEAPGSALAPEAEVLLALDHQFSDRPAEAAAAFAAITERHAGTPHEETAALSKLRLHVREEDKAAGRAHFNALWQDPRYSTSFYPRSPYWKAFVEPLMPEEKSGSQWMLYPEPAPDPMTGAQADAASAPADEQALSIPITLPPM